MVIPLIGKYKVVSKLSSQSVVMPPAGPYPRILYQNNKKKSHFFLTLSFFSSDKHFQYNP